MNKGEHPQNLEILRDHMIRFLETQINALRQAQFSSRAPATTDYDNSLRLTDGRFIVIKQGIPLHGDSLRYCVGSGEDTLEPDPAQWFDRQAPPASWDGIAQQRAPWVALNVVRLAVSP